MARESRLKYKIRVLLLMAIYVALMLFEWPLVQKTPEPAVRAILALLPTLPVVIVIALAARMVMRGDELEQRLHLIALGVAMGVVSVASIVGAFLVMARVWQVGGDVLIWVFPALCIVYGATRVALVRRFTGTWNFWAC